MNGDLDQKLTSKMFASASVVGLINNAENGTINGAE
jgi:hypothetical protein